MDFELIGSGEEGLVYRRGRLVVKRLYTEKVLDDVRQIQKQARERIANPTLPAAWPIDYVAYRDVVFMIQRFFPGVTAAEIMDLDRAPQWPVEKEIYLDRKNYWNPETINASYLARLVSGGKTVEEAIADGKVVYDYGSENFRIHKNEITVVDVSFIGRSRVAQVLRETTTLGRKDRISILQEQHRQETEALLVEMEEEGLFDRYAYLETETRIAVVGNSGSGKSTLSQELAYCLGLQHLSIDRILWSPGWEERDREDYANAHQNWIERDDWLIDGIGHWTELARRLRRATHVIHVDLPVELCVERARKRMANEMHEPNPHIADGCTYSDVADLQMRVIRDYHAETRPRLLHVLDSIAAPTLTIIEDEQPGEYARNAVRFVTVAEAPSKPSKS